MLDFIIGPEPLAHDPTRQVMQRHELCVAEHKFILDIYGSGKVHPLIIKESDLQVFVFGYMVYKQEGMRASALSVARAIFNGGLDEKELAGTFTFIATNGSSIKLLTDWIGTSVCYGAGNIKSSSFLLAARYGEALEPNPQGLYEYVFQGTTYGQDTILKGVHRLHPTQIHNLVDETACDRCSPIEAGDLSVSEIEERTSAHLDAGFANLSQAFPEKIESAISGGFDSRLILCLLVNHCSKFGLHVYGSAHDPDVVAAKAICEDMEIPLKHIDKSQLSNEVEYASVVSNNFVAFDGYPTDGIFDRGADLATRRSHLSEGKILLNGGGGEIFRNFFYLPSNVTQTRTVVDAFYHQFDPKSCGPEFSRDTYVARVLEKVEFELMAVPLSGRQRLEAIYPLFRCRYWTARNSSINCRHGYYATPLLTPQAVSLALQLPIEEKHCGAFQARLITRLHGKLANIEFDYGFKPCDGPTRAYRIKSFLNRHRPLYLRRHAFAFKGYLAKAALQDRSEEIGLLASATLPYTSRFFAHREMRSQPHLDRLLTAEYAYQALL